MSIYNEKHIHEDAYNRGIRDFRLGGYSLAKINSFHKKLLKTRIYHLLNKELKLAEHIEEYFNNSDNTYNRDKLYLKDETLKEDNISKLYTKVYRKSEPVCPYRLNTLWAKEWQRGVNFAYNDNLKTVIIRETIEKENL